MADVFVSYSRSDAEFVRRLAEDLKKCGKDVWVDVDGVRDAEKFPEALRRAIESSDAFVFVISPDSAGSEFCEQEVAHASALNKRIVPLALRPVVDERIPEEIRLRNWIPVGEDPGVERVLAAIETDLEWERQHTRITLRALQWEQAGRDRSVLLRGSELADAERWLAAGAGKDLGPTALEQEYLLAARQAASRRQRTLTAAVSGMLVVAVGLLVFALISRERAVSAESSANAQRLAALSETQLSIDPERAALLAMAAVRKEATYGPSGTMFALRAALDDSTIRYRLPGAGHQHCGSLYPQFDPAPGSNLLAEGLCDGKVRFFNATTGRLERVATVGSPKDQAILLGYPARRAVLEGAVGDRLVALNPVTARLERRGPLVPHLGADAFDPSEPLVAAIGRLGRLVVWNYRTGRASVQRLRLPLASITDLTFGPPGLLAFSFAFGTSPGPGVVLYDYVHRRIVATALTKLQAGNVAYAPNGRSLAVGATSPNGTGTVELLNGRTLAVDRSFHPKRDPFEFVGGLAWSLDGRYLAYGFKDGSAGVLDAATGRLVHAYAYATSTVLGLAISPNDRLLVTSSSDGTTVAFSTHSRALRTIDAGGSIAQLGVVPDGFVTIANPGSRRDDGVVVERFSDQGRPQAPPLVLARSSAAIAASLSPSGSVAATAPGGPRTPHAPLHVWSVGARRVVATTTLLNGVGNDPVIAPQNDVIATGVSPLHGQSSPPGRLELINLRTGHRRVIASNTCDWQDYAFSPSGSTIAASTFCGQVFAWSIATGRRLGGSFQTPGVNSFALSPDGRSLAIASTNGTVYVSPVPLTDHTRQLNVSTKSAQAVAWSPNGRYLASSGLDLKLRIYDARTLTELRVIPLADPPQGLAFTSDSQDLLTWDASGTVQLWNACTDCENPSALEQLARSRVTRSLTPAERKTYGVG